MDTCKWNQNHSTNMNHHSYMQLQDTDLAGKKQSTRISIHRQKYLRNPHWSPRYLMRTDSCKWNLHYATNKHHQNDMVTINMDLGEKWNSYSWFITIRKSTCTNTISNRCTSRMWTATSKICHGRRQTWTTIVTYDWWTRDLSDKYQSFSWLTLNWKLPAQRAFVTDVLDENGQRQVKSVAVDDKQ